MLFLFFDLVWRGFPEMFRLVRNDATKLALIRQVRFGVCLPFQDFIPILDVTVAD